MLHADSQLRACSGKQFSFAFHSAQGLLSELTREGSLPCCSSLKGLPVLIPQVTSCPTQTKLHCGSDNHKERLCQRKIITTEKITQSIKLFFNVNHCSYLLSPGVSLCCVLCFVLGTVSCFHSVKQTLVAGITICSPDSFQHSVSLDTQTKTKMQIRFFRVSPSIVRYAAGNLNQS